MSVWERIRGVWHDFAEPAPTPEAEQGPALIDAEIASIGEGQDITRGYVDGLPLLQPEDKLLNSKLGGDIEGYRQLMSDPDVKVAWDQRTLGLVAREWYVEPGAGDSGSKKAADQMREILTHIGWDEATRKMQLGVFWGYAFAECMWASDGATITLDNIKVKKPKRFGFRPDGMPVLLTTSQPMGKPLPPRKFWRFASGALDDDEPYGLGLAHWLYWPVWFHRNGDKFWAHYLEGLARPSVIGKHPPNAEKQQKDLLLKALRAVHQNGAIAISSNLQVELLRAMQSSGGDYDKFVARWTSMIYRLIVGQDFSITGAGGQYKGDNLMDVQRSIIKADADLINVSFARQVGAWLTDWNYPGAKPPRVWRRVEDAPDQQKLAETHSKMFTVGYRPTLAQVSKVYGGEWEPVIAGKNPPDGDPNPLPPTSGGAPLELAEGDLPPTPTAVVEAMVRRLGRDAEPLLLQWFDEIDKAMAQADREGLSLAEFQAQVPELFDKLDSGPLGELMRESLAAANLAGRYAVETESDGG